VSADNWTTCPRCAEQARLRFQAEDDRVAALYGKVPAAEYEAERTKLAATDFAPDETFREDYEWYIDDGYVRGVYSGSCSACGLKASARVDQRFWAPEAAASTRRNSREPAVE
jgi:hypothetical protein